MSAFAISQLLVVIAIGFDLLSFQFKHRRQIIACLVVSCLLVALHFALLGHWTATGLGMVAAVRFIASYCTTSKKMMAFFLVLTLLIAAITFNGMLSVIGCLGSLFGTVGSFCQDDKRLRQVLLVATSLWLIHNILAGSPTAVLLETVFIGSNLLGYYRFYWRRAGKAGMSSEERAEEKTGRWVC